MEVLLIGANKGLGYEILKELTKNEIKVNCLVRKKGLINLDSSSIKIFYGDATNLKDLKKALGKSKIIIAQLMFKEKIFFPGLN